MDEIERHLYALEVTAHKARIVKLERSQSGDVYTQAAEAVRNAKPHASITQADVDEATVLGYDGIARGFERVIRGGSHIDGDPGQSSDRHPPSGHTPLSVYPPLDACHSWPI